MKEQLLTTVVVATIAFLLGLIFAYPAMIIWNWALVPTIPSINPVGFWQMYGIMVLIQVLKGTSIQQTKQ
jgi:ABC-type phosphate/phosphonate transport system permease subunit